MVRNTLLILSILGSSCVAIFGQLSITSRDTDFTVNFNDYRGTTLSSTGGVSFPTRGRSMASGGPMFPLAGPEIVEIFVGLLV